MTCEIEVVVVVPGRIPNHPVVRPHVYYVGGERAGSVHYVTQ